MAFNSIPKNLSEMRAVAGSSIDAKYQAGIISFYRKLVKAHGMEDPLAFNPATTSGKSCKLVRALKGEVDVAKLKKECKLDANFKISWGDGSRGNRGTGNTGNLFEGQLEKGLNDWIEEGDYHTNPYRDFIADLIKFYDLENCQIVKVVAEGGENKKRPIQFVGGNWKIGDADANHYDIGPIVTDLTLTTKCKGKPEKVIYLSLKKGGTTTMSNLGVKKIFTKEDIQNGNIQTDVGKLVLETFGIDNARFCRIFNEALTGQVKSGGNDTSPKFNRTLLQGMIRGSIGYGYHYTHKQSGNKIKNFPMKKETCDRATRVTSVTVHYGGKTGTGQRVDITVQTPVMELKFNIRDTSGSSLPWPDKLQSAYKFKSEQIFSTPEDGYED
jgi:hypothetical protein